MRQGTVLALLLTVSFAAVITAQSPVGSLRIRVTGPTGGVAVAAQNTETGYVRRLTTGADGNFVATLLSPAPYNVTIEAHGHTYRINAVVHAATTTVIEFGARPDGLSVIRAVAPNDSNQLAGIVDRTHIENLPVNGGNVLDLASLERKVSAAFTT